MAPSSDKNYAYLHLPRGGICIRRENVDQPDQPFYLNLQIGSPPETLKDTLNNPEWPVGVPRDFVVPARLIDPRSIVTLAELEFPGYYHYFEHPAKNNIRIFIDDPEQEAPLRVMLNEAVFGPRIKREDFKNDFSDPEQAFDIAGECEYFNQFSFEDVFDIRVKQPGEKRLVISPFYELAILQQNGLYHYKLYEKGNASAVFTCNEIDLFSSKQIVHKRNVLMRRPDFAVSAVGNSTGFDERGETSGFVIWVNGHGIMIDPPANTRLWLEENNVLPEETDRVILTHCHADHDAGLLQRIMENDHLDIYTTATVWNSFKRKYDRLMEELQPFYRWNEIKIGDTVNIEGADFRFYYSLHSVPTIAFTVLYKDVNVFYSSDMRFSRATYDDMKKAGKIQADRYNYFTRDHISLFQKADFILHEAGGDPLHTTMDELDTLDLSIKRKTFVYHLSEIDYERMRSGGISDFSLIPTGMDKHGIKVFFDDRHIPETPDESFLKYCVLFHEMKLRDVKLIQRNCQVRRIQKGSILFKKDDQPNFDDNSSTNGFVYLIYSGIAAVVSDNNVKLKEYHKYDFVGETAVLMDQPRNAGVMALDDLVTYAIPNKAFKEVIQPYEALFKRLQLNRGHFIETAMARSFFTVSLSWRARTDLQLIAGLRKYNKGDELMNGGGERFLFIISGRVKVNLEDERVLEFPVTLANKLKIDHVGDPNQSGPWGVQTIEVLDNATIILELSKAEYIDFCKRHGTFRWRWRYLKTYFPGYILG